MCFSAEHACQSKLHKNRIYTEQRLLLLLKVELAFLPALTEEGAVADVIIQLKFICQYKIKAYI